MLEFGSGTVNLAGQNTYTGGTSVYGTVLVNGSLANTFVNVYGMLGGYGTIAGPVSIASGAILAPGTTDINTLTNIGTLTINNVLTNTSATFIKVSKTGSTVTNDSVKGVSTLVFGGTLMVDNIGSGILTVGDSLKIFSATTYNGAFTNITPAPPGPGLVWNTNNLAVNGTLAVALGAVQPQINQASMVGTNLVLNGSGGCGRLRLFHPDLNQPRTTDG